jgi:hypothetical protein
MLVDNEVTLEKIFSSTPLLLQCIVRMKRPSKNLEKIQSRVGEDIPVTAHHLIRSEEEPVPLQSSSANKNRSACMYFIFLLPKKWICLPTKFH